jgi:hypothetical protein
VRARLRRSGISAHTTTRPESGKALEISPGQIPSRLAMYAFSPRFGWVRTSASLTSRAAKPGRVVAPLANGCPTFPAAQGPARHKPTVTRSMCPRINLQPVHSRRAALGARPTQPAGRASHRYHRLGRDHGESWARANVRQGFTSRPLVGVSTWPSLQTARRSQPRRWRCGCRG